MKKILITLLVAMLFLVSCGQSSTRSINEKAQEKINNVATNTIPVPELSYFQERKTVANWAKRWDKPSVPTYVYLVSFGKVLGYYVADGKPASTRSYLTPEDQRISFADDTIVVSAPDIDGTYGTNGAGKYFFTTDGTYVEFNCEYILCDKPLSIAQPPILTLNLDQTKKTK